MYDYIVLDVEATKIPEFKPWHDNAYLCSVCIETPDKISKVWFFNPLLGDELTHSPKRDSGTCQQCSHVSWTQH